MKAITISNKPTGLFGKSCNHVMFKSTPSNAFESIFFHEALILSVINRSMTEKELVKKFPDYSYIIDKVLTREVETGKLHSFKRKGKRYFKATPCGKKVIDIERRQLSSQ